MVPPLIALEEHFDTKLFESDLLHDNLPAQLQDQLRDIGPHRIEALDAGKVSIQVLSHIGSVTPVKECIKSNDLLAAACRQYPGRFAGFAQLPMQDPEAAVAELERTIGEHGFVGALINNHCGDGTMYDDKKLWPVFEKAVSLDVPIYIHPVYPADNISGHYAGDFSQIAAVMLGTAGWGWHSETGLHILRLFASGLFDAFPDLKIVSFVALPFSARCDLNVLILSGHWTYGRNAPLHARPDLP